MYPNPFHNFLPLYPMNSGRGFQYIIFHRWLSFPVYLSVPLKVRISCYTHPSSRGQQLWDCTEGAPACSTPCLGVSLFPIPSAKFQWFCLTVSLARNSPWMFTRIEGEITGCGQVWSPLLWHPIPNGMAPLLPTNLTYSAGLSKKEKKGGKGKQKNKENNDGKRKKRKGQQRKREKKRN